MTEQGLFQILLYMVVLFSLVIPLGVYMARVYAGESTGFFRWFASVENGLYRLSGVKPEQEMHWRQYALALLVFNMLGLLILYLLQRFQDVLPLNPEHLQIGRASCRERV